MEKVTEGYEREKVIPFLFFINVLTFIGIIGIIKKEKDKGGDKEQRKMEEKRLQNIFFAETDRIKREGIKIDKKFISDLKIQSKCEEYAETFLGADMRKIYDKASAKAYLRSLLGEKEFRVLSNAKTMGLTYSIDRLLLLLKLLERRKADNFVEVQGVSYFLIGCMLEEEFKTIVNSCKGSRLYPIYVDTSNCFKWSKCPAIFRKYVIRFAVEEGYVGYYYEKPNLTHVAFLNRSIGLSGEEAESVIRRQSKGIWFKDLTLEDEFKLSKEILLGGCDALDGMYASQVLGKTLKYESDLGYDSPVATVYNQEVLPKKIAFMGMVLKKLREDVRKDLEEGVYKINYVSEDRIGVLVKEGHSLEEVLPTMHIHFKRIPSSMTPRGLVIRGDWL